MIAGTGSRHSRTATSEHRIIELARSNDDATRSSSSLRRLPYLPTALREETLAIIVMLLTAPYLGAPSGYASHGARFCGACSVLIDNGLRPTRRTTGAIDDSRRRRLHLKRCCIVARRRQSHPAPRARCVCCSQRIPDRTKRGAKPGMTLRESFRSCSL